jgi:hypothetical protein
MSYVCQELMTLLPGTAGRQRVFCRTFRSLKAQKLDPELWAAVVVANPLNLNGGISFIHIALNVATPTKLLVNRRVPGKCQRVTSKLFPFLLIRAC